MKSNRPCLTREETSDYLDNNLNEAQKYDIEHHLQDCELCEAALQGYALTNVSPAVPDLDRIRKKIGAQPTEQKPSPQPAKIKSLGSNFNWLAAAAVVALGIAAAWFYSNQETNLFADFYKPYNQSLMATRAATDNNNDALTKGLEAYQAGNFVQSLVLFEKAKTIDPENGNIALYAGIAALETEDHDKSIEWLTEARINQPSAYGTATWYLAMAQLAKKNYPACRNTLKQIKITDSPYYEQAQDLFDQLADK